jgi:TonB-dependent SusC/RagA subfamily outer membrane receptor
MKKVFCLMGLLAAAQLGAQHGILESLFSADFILANKQEIGLQQQQEERIVAIQNRHQQSFAARKAQLEKENGRMREMLQEERSADAALSKQFAQVLALENELKTLQFQNLLALKGVLTERQIGMLNSAKTPAARSQESLLIGKVEKRGEDQPLFIVQSKKKSAVVTDVEAIDPADIQSVEVLKGEKATAQYGAAGAHGVIVITLRAGAAYKLK